MRLLITALLCLALAERHVAVAQPSDARVLELESRVESLDARLGAITRDRQALADRLGSAEALQQRASDLERDRVARMRVLDGVIEDAAQVDLALMTGADGSSELASLRARLAALYEGAVERSGRLESDAEAAAVHSADLAMQALAESDWLRARGHLAGLAEAASVARDAAAGNPGRAWER